MMIIQINLTSVQYPKLFNIKQMRHAKNFDFFIHIEGEIYSFNLNKKHFFFKMNMLIVAAASFLPFFGSAIYYNSAIELPNSFGIFDNENIVLLLLTDHIFCKCRVTTQLFTD